MAQTVGRVETQHGAAVTECQLNYYGRRLATAGEDGHVKIWEVSKPDSPVQIGTLSGHEGTVTSVDWAHPKYPGLIATSGYDRQVRIFLMRTTSFSSAVLYYNSFAQRKLEKSLSFPKYNLSRNSVQHHSSHNPPGDYLEGGRRGPIPDRLSG